MRSWASRNAGLGIIALALNATACGGEEGPPDTGLSLDGGGAQDGSSPDASSDAATNADGPSIDAQQETCAARSEVVRFTTSDGVSLEADYQTPGPSQRGAVILLHMAPPTYSRANYPSTFRDRLVRAGFTVLNVDRRGAGGSSGNASEAAIGQAAALDAIAARTYVLSRACAPRPEAISWVAGSNGTTSFFDMLVQSPAAQAAPHAVVWLSPGTYTENQNAIASHRSLLDPLPMMWIYPSAERNFSETFHQSAASSWVFLEFPGDAHGTELFSVTPSLEESITSFLLGSFVPYDGGLGGFDADTQDGGIDADGGEDSGPSGDAGFNDAAADGAFEDATAEDAAADA